MLYISRSNIIEICKLFIAATEDAQFTNQDIYLLYFKNASVSIDHASVRAIIKDAGYPQDSVTLVANIYSHSNTIFTREHFGQTQTIPIQRGTIQGDTVSPYLFIIFRESLLQWSPHGKHGYTLGTSKIIITSSPYADDLAILTNKLTSLQHEPNKVDKYCEWAGMDLAFTECAITRCPNKSKMNQKPFTSLIEATNITYKNQPIPILHQHEPYVYIGIQLIPSLQLRPYSL